MKMALSKNKKRLLGLILITLLFAYYFCLPAKLFTSPYSTRVNSSSGDLLSAHIASDGQWRFEATDSVPDKFKQAIILFEDEYFHYHPGFNPVSMGRALLQNIKAGKVKSGGSTLSMQVIRMAYNRPRTIINKLIETIQATRLEWRYSKEEILQLYAGQAPFGGNVVGIEAASWRYFGRSPRELSWSEAALLAVLPNAPALIHPGRNRDALVRKRNFLLSKLLSKGLIDSTEHYLACAEPLPDKPLPLPQLTPHLLTSLSKKSEQSTFNTTLHSDVQKRANQIVENYYSIYRHNEIHNLACIVIENKSGNVLAYVGNSRSQSMDKGQNVDVIPALRSSGSTLKPFLYAAALDDGLILPEMLLVDIPTFYSDFSPKNYSKQFDGAVAAHTALSRSLNVPFVRLLREYGTGKLQNKLQKAGLSSINKPASHYGLSLILGGAEVSLWELSSSYSSMARCLNTFTKESSRYNADDYRMASLLKKKDNKQPQFSFQPSVFSAAAVYHTFEALTNVQRPEEETGWENFSSGRKIAWKTGTSFGFRDAWAIGVTPEYTVGIWVGNASGEGRPGIIGGSAAAPLMFDLYRYLPSTSWFETPYDDLQAVSICRSSGYKASQHCHQVDTVYVPAAQHDLPVCPYHQLIHLSADNKYRVNADCYPPHLMNHKSWFVLPPVMAWYFQSRHPLYKALPPFRPGCYEQQEAIEIIYPQKNAQLYVPLEMDGSLGRIICKAAHRKSNSRLYWHLDDHYLGETVHHHQMEMMPEKGSHTLIVTDENGNAANCRFECLGKGE